MRWFIWTWPDSKEEWSRSMHAPGHSPRAPRFCYDHPQDFTGVNTDTGKGMDELKNYIEAIRRLPLDDKSKQGRYSGRHRGTVVEAIAVCGGNKSFVSRDRVRRFTSAFHQHDSRQ